MNDSSEDRTKETTATAGAGSWRISEAPLITDQFRYVVHYAMEKSWQDGYVQALTDVSKEMNKRGLLGAIEVLGEIVVPSFKIGKDGFVIYAKGRGGDYEQQKKNAQAGVRFKDKACECWERLNVSKGGDEKGKRSALFGSLQVPILQWLARW